MCIRDRFDIPLLGKIPFDPRISIAADEGSAFVDQYGDTPAGQTFLSITDKIRMFLEQKPQQINGVDQ